MMIRNYAIKEGEINEGETNLSPGSSRPNKLPAGQRIENRLMTMEEVAGYLRLSPGTIQNKVSKRQIPFIKMGGAVRFRRLEIDAWLEILKKPVRK